MKHSIRLDIVHPDKRRVEHFLNSVDEDLTQVPFDSGDLKSIDDISAGFRFESKGRSLRIIVIFATSYFHANEIEAANLNRRPGLTWTINGTVLFGVESDDEDVSNRLLSLFAGEE